MALKMVQRILIVSNTTHDTWADTLYVYVRVGIDIWEGYYECNKWDSKFADYYEFYFQIEKWY